MWVTGFVLLVCLQVREVWLFSVIGKTRSVDWHMLGFGESDQFGVFSMKGLKKPYRQGGELGNI